MRPGALRRAALFSRLDAREWASHPPIPECGFAALNTSERGSSISVRLAGGLSLGDFRREQAQGQRHEQHCGQHVQRGDATSQQTQVGAGDGNAADPEELAEIP
jgi:hypothetical protein